MSYGREMTMRTDHGAQWAARMTALFSMLLCLLFLPRIVPSALAGIPVNEEVFVYNVDVRQFSVVWEVNVPSTCTIKVFKDIGGELEAEECTCVSLTNNSTLAQERGLMQVDVRDLPSDGTMYYIQTVSTEMASGTTHQ